MAFTFREAGSCSYVEIDDPYGGESMFIHIIDNEYDGVTIEVRNAQGEVVNDLALDVSWNDL